MFDISCCYDLFSTKPDSAYFWSGLGKNGENIAADIAKENGGVTLEALMHEHKDRLIEAGFEYDKELDRFLFSAENYSDWEAISRAYAEQASGQVHVVLGDNVRPDGVWNTKEFPTLSQNDDVHRVISVDPKTGKETAVLLDKSLNSQSSNTQASFHNISSSNVASINGGGARAPDIEISGRKPENVNASDADEPSVKAGRLPEPQQNNPENANLERAGALPGDKQDLVLFQQGNDVGSTGKDLATGAGKKISNGAGVDAGIV